LPSTASHSVNGSVRCSDASKENHLFRFFCRFDNCYAGARVTEASSAKCTGGTHECPLTIACRHRAKSTRLKHDVGR
jgi:hypothetical protein